MQGQRSRNDDGSLRQKRGDTLVRTIEEQYDARNKAAAERLAQIRESMGGDSETNQ